MSGFTTTGATVLTDIRALDRSMLMWRQFTQWLGGMGIIVLALAVLPRLRVGGRQLLESELPGPEIEPLADLHPTDGTAALAALRRPDRRCSSLILALLRLDGRRPTHGSVRGGRLRLHDDADGRFRPRAASVESVRPATQWVIVVFMVVAGAELRASPTARSCGDSRSAAPRRGAARSTSCPAARRRAARVELWSEGISEGEAAVRDVDLPDRVDDDHDGLRERRLHSVDGARADDARRADVRRRLAGSTGGSVKVVRHLLLGKSLRRELRPDRAPRTGRCRSASTAWSSTSARCGARRRSCCSTSALRLGTAGVAVDASRRGARPERASTPSALSATTLGNVGPAFGVAGPMGSFARFSDVSTVVIRR